MEITVDTKELLRWADKLEANFEKQTKSSIAQSLNKFGHNVQHQVVASIAEAKDTTQTEINKQTKIKLASARDLTWEMDIDIDLATTMLRMPAGRQLPQWRTKTGRPFVPSGLLVDVITAGDVIKNIVFMGMGHGEGIPMSVQRLVEVCEKCEEIADKGPYTIEEIQQKWVTGAVQLDLFYEAPPGVTNLFHPNCRCSVWPVNRKWKDITIAPPRFAAEPVTPVGGPLRFVEKEGEIMPGQFTAGVNEALSFEALVKRLVTDLGTTIVRLK